MKNLNSFITEKFLINKNTKIYNYQPKTKNELKGFVNKLIIKHGNNANLNDIDTSKITDMSELFYQSSFNGYISDWDVSNVKDMSYMFARSEFTGENGDISKWNVRNVEKMENIFKNSPLEKNPPKWYKK